MKIGFNCSSFDLLHAGHVTNGIELYYHKRQHSFSSTDLRERTYQLEALKRTEKL